MNNTLNIASNWELCTQLKRTVKSDQNQRRNLWKPLLLPLLLIEHCRAPLYFLALRSNIAKQSVVVNPFMLITMLFVFSLRHISYIWPIRTYQPTVLLIFDTMLSNIYVKFGWRKNELLHKLIPKYSQLKDTLYIYKRTLDKFVYRSFWCRLSKYVCIELSFYVSKSLKGILVIRCPL